jgi:hypothetical protein
MYKKRTATVTVAGVAVAAALAVAGTGGSSAVGTAELDWQPPETVPAEARDLDLTGQVKDSQSQPVDSEIAVYAWPVHEGTIELEQVGAAQSDDAGRYEVQIQPSERIVEQVGDQGGWVDLVVYASPAGDVEKPIAQGTVSVPLTDNAAGAKAKRDAPVRKRVNMTPVDPRQRQSASAGCGPPHSSKLAKEVKKTTIGELNNAYGDTNASFDYSRGGSSEIAVATSTSAGGPYVSAGFTHTVSNTGSAGVGLSRNERYGKKLLSQFEYGKYVSAYCGSARYYWRADEWHGGLDQEGQGDTLDKCEKRPPAAEQMPGSRFVRDRNKAESYSNAVQVGGLSLSARSGFSETVTTRFSFGKQRKRYWVCGNRNDAPTSAGRIFTGTKE